METLKELNKKYKEFLDTMKTGVSLVIAMANGKYDRWLEYGDCSDSTDEDLMKDD
jgi:hypothetical protein